MRLSYVYEKNDKKKNCLNIDIRIRKRDKRRVGVRGFSKICEIYQIFSLVTD
jgi:hypothetical protein